MCTGCTCVMNQAMISLLQEQRPKFTIMHDFWIYLVGSCFGKVIYDETSYILYRQHEQNAIGASSSLWENYKKRVKNFKKHRGQLTRQAEELLNIYGTKISQEKKELLQHFILAKQNRKIRIQILKKNQIFRQRKSDDLIVKSLLFWGML